MDSTDTLQPRYRRVMSFGDVLDESIRVWREHWVRYALVSAVALLPPGLLLVWLGTQRSGLLQAANIAALESGTLAPEAYFGSQVGGFGVYFVISIVFGFLWSGAVITTTDGFLRGREPAISAVYGTALRRLGVMLLSVLVFLAGCLGLLVPTVLLLIPSVGGLLGGPVALIGLLVWWLRPGSRKTWFKWLIVLATPYGLMMYVAGRWTMFVAAIVLERQGAVAALRRSWQLTQGRWFRVVGVLFLAALIVGILIGVVTNALQIPLTVTAVSRGEPGMGPAETALVYAVNVVFQVLFSSMSGAVYAVLFNDLRNRREGTDIAERLRELEATPQSLANA